MPVTADVWGSDVSHALPSTVGAWNRAWDQTLHFEGEPFETLADANRNDESFALGSVFCATYRVLGATPLDDPTLQSDVARARARATTDRDRSHVVAVEHLAAGNYTDAARQWEAIAGADRDFVAARFAHDAGLHAFDIDVMVRTAQTALDQWGEDPGWHYLAGQLAFALEESGEIVEAEALGQRALEADPRDVWARHALAHVYETADNQAAAFELLRDDQSWTGQDGLAVHLWWHLALRLVAAGHLDEALNLHDRIVDAATTPFRLCDLTSLLWRVELAGASVGERWRHIAESFASRPETQSGAFIAVHAALAFTRCPDHPGAGTFFERLGRNPDAGRGRGQAAQIFRDVVAPVARAVRSWDHDPAAVVAALDAVGPDMALIGGSIAQRDVLALTRTALTRGAVAPPAVTPPAVPTQESHQ